MALCAWPRLAQRSKGELPTIHCARLQNIRDQQVRSYRCKKVQTTQFEGSFCQFLVKTKSTSIKPGFCVFAFRGDLRGDLRVALVLTNVKSCFLCDHTDACVKECIIISTSKQAPFACKLAKWVRTFLRQAYIILWTFFADHFNRNQFRSKEMYVLQLMMWW